jgi:hypothetical protein
MMKFCVLLLGLALLCACRTIRERKEERSAAYLALPPAWKQLIDRGRIVRGMDTNAVYIVLGPPSSASDNPVAGGTQTLWIYFGSHVVHVPGWTYLPNEQGQWTLQYTTSHHAARYTEAEVLFVNGRVTEWRRF